jgi:transcriptional regulator GlxA family with amidase domain
LEGVFDTGLTVLLDAFTTANELAAMQMGGDPKLEFSVVGLRDKVTTGLGMQVTVETVTPDLKPDWVIVPALNTKMPEQLIPSLGREDMIEAQMQLRIWHANGVGIGASCIGTFLLAESGLLDGHEATTTWWLAPLFRQRYPQVSVDEGRMLVPSGNLVTAGAAMGHLDLALWLIGKASPDLATLVARYMLADLRSSQAQYVIPGHLAHADPVIERFERWARGRLHAGFSLQDGAKALAISPRTLQRRMESVLGKSPLAFFQDLRVERARHLIQTSSLDLDAIAAEVGYLDGATLRTLLRQRLGHGVRALRAAR